MRIFSFLFCEKVYKFYEDFFIKSDVFDYRKTVFGPEKISPEISMLRTQILNIMKQNQKFNLLDFLLKKYKDYPLYISDLLGRSLENPINTLSIDAIDIIDWVGLDFKAMCDKYPDLTGQHIAYNNMLRSLDILIEHKKDFEVRITCDPRFVDKSDLMEIMGILQQRNVQNVAIQKYIPHFEDEAHKTTDAMRNQIFVDADLRNQINNMFKSVVWRE